MQIRVIDLLEITYSTMQKAVLRAIKVDCGVIADSSGDSLAAVAAGGNMRL